MRKKILISLSGLIVLMLLIHHWTQKQASDNLLFNNEEFTLKTIKVETSEGEKEIVLHAFMHIPYVSNPIDKDYQSLNILVPVNINGMEINSSKAPILFKIDVGGYHSVNNALDKLPDAEHPDLREDLALANGIVVVTPGCRGIETIDKNGKFIGKAPAAIVDLKAAIRYLRYNKKNIPGDVNKIVAAGCSAGGALAALLGTSANSPLYNPYLNKIGAAQARDLIFAAACYNPITDLEHADMAYEWMFGALPLDSVLVNQKLSEQLSESFAAYLDSLELEGKYNFGKLTTKNYPDYLLDFYLYPSANQFLNELPEPERITYLTDNPWISWNNEKASFTFTDYLTHMGRMKGIPAFDDFSLQQPEPQLFGDSLINACHFTNFSLKQVSENQQASLSPELKKRVQLMNPMYFLQKKNQSTAKYWWLRNGTIDNHTSQTVMINLATMLENQNKKWMLGYSGIGAIVWMKIRRILLNGLSK